MKEIKDLKDEYKSCVSDGWNRMIFVEIFLQRNYKISIHKYLHEITINSFKFNGIKILAYQMINTSIE